MYLTEIKEKQIFERIRWQLRIFESVFYKSLIRACSFGNFLAASQNARSNGQTSNHRHCEFVKNALKKCSCCHPLFLYIFLLIFFLTHTTKHYSNHGRSPQKIPISALNYKIGKLEWVCMLNVIVFQFL